MSDQAHDPHDTLIFAFRRLAADQVRLSESRARWRGWALIGWGVALMCASLALVAWLGG
jgi:hypothetical protein